MIDRHVGPEAAWVARIRSFNRSWTETLGLLERGLLDTPHRLTEARVLFELGQRDGAVERAGLQERMGIDASFLTRVLARLERQGLVTSAPSPHDGRARVIGLTDDGRAAATQLDERSRHQIDDLLTEVSPGQRADLVESLGRAQHLIRPGGADRSVTIRPLGQPGDLGWVIGRHGAVYADEFGWNSDLEALVARIVADYHADRVAGREQAWVAEVGGVRAGCVFCCRRDDDTAQLRILLVERWARGLSLGRRLVDECLAFATAAGYRSIMLWTNDVLVAARRIYQAAGFRLMEEEAHHSFGHDLNGQIWTLDLPAPADHGAPR